MNNNKKIVWGVMLIALSLPAMASDHHQFVDTLANDPFFKNTKMDLVARNYWKYLKEDESSKKIVHSAWGQSFALDYKSGYFMDLIGFDAIATGAIKLGASENFASRGILYRTDNNKARGFSKIGQRYVKVKLANDFVQFYGKVGWQILKNYGVLTASNRLSQNSYLGYSGSLHYDELTLDMAYIRSAINRDSSHKVHFTTKQGQAIDHITTGGLTYKNKIVQLAYAYGESEDYIRRHVIESTYKLTQKLTLGMQLYGSYALDEYKKMASNKREFDKHAWHYASDIKWKENDWSLKFGVAYTDANKKEGLGYYDRHLAKNMRGRFNALTSAGADYMRDGELALTALGTYDFIDDLTTGLQINYGQFDYKGHEIWTGEVTLINHWKPSDSRLKNLSLFSMFGVGRSYKNKNRTPTLNKGKPQSSPNLSGEVIIEYRFNLF